MRTDVGGLSEDFAESVHGVVKTYVNGHADVTRRLPRGRRNGM